MNLLEETIEFIERYGYDPVQIIFIGSERTGHSCSWEEFKLLANQEYDEEFGVQEVATDLVIVFEGGAQMWRHENDGAERWAVHRPFRFPEERKPIRSLFTNSVGWDSLEEINKN